MTLNFLCKMKAYSQLHTIEPQTKFPGSIATDYLQRPNIDDLKIPYLNVHDGLPQRA